MYFGGNEQGSRLATMYKKGLTEGDILAELRPIFKAYKHFKLVHPQVPPAAA
jgi:sulfite reductase beta subunit-like hemoprotein